jgi:phenylacetate-CoA ligase
MAMGINKIYYSLPKSFQNILLSVYGYRLKRLRYNKHFYKRLLFLEESIKWSTEEIEQYQNEQLQKIVYHAYKTVSYYTKLFDKLNLKPRDIQTKQDLRKLPILTKQDVLKDPNSFLSTSPGDKVVYVQTSGSSGTPLKIATTPYALACEYANNWRQRRWYGVDIGDKLATFNGRLVCDPHAKTKTPFRKNYAFNQTLFSLYHLDKYHRDKMVEEILKGDYKYLNGYPSTLEYLASSPLLKKDKPKGIKAIFTSSETLTEKQREIIEYSYNCKISDYYGSAENICGFNQYIDNLYYHCSEDGIVELNNICQNTYKLICTGFNNFAMPLLRYDIGDTIEATTQKGTFDRLVVKKILGREDDIIMTPEGKEIGRLDHIFKGLQCIGRCQIVQNKKDKVIFKVETLEGFNHEEEKKLLLNAKERLGNMKIKIELVDNIPVEKNGKFKAVKSYLK